MELGGARVGFDGHATASLVIVDREARVPLITVAPESDGDHACAISAPGICIQELYFGKLIVLPNSGIAEKDWIGRQMIKSCVNIWISDTSVAVVHYRARGKLNCEIVPMLEAWRMSFAFKQRCRWVR